MTAYKMTAVRDDAVRMTRRGKPPVVLVRTRTRNEQECVLTGAVIPSGSDAWRMVTSARPYSYVAGHVVAAGLGQPVELPDRPMRQDGRPAYPAYVRVAHALQEARCLADALLDLSAELGPDAPVSLRDAREHTRALLACLYQGPGELDVGRRLAVDRS